MTRPKDSTADGHDDGRDKVDETIERISGGLSEWFRRASGDETPKKDPEQKLLEGPSKTDYFFKAVRRGQAEAVRAFLAQGIHPDSVDKRGDTALLLCARAGLIDVADVLLSGGADPLKTAKDGGKSPIEEALNFGKSGMVKLLTQRGGYKHGDIGGGMSLFHRACEKGNISAVKALMEAGVDGNERTENGSTPLIITVQTRQTGVAEVLLENETVAAGMNNFHADTDSLQRTAFQLAVEKGSTGIIGRMLAKGAFANLRDAGGETPLIRAIAQGNLLLIETLVKAGADLNREDAPLVFACHTAEIRSEPRRGEVVALLLRLGADPDQRDGETGLTPLHAAALAQNGRDAMKVLLQNSANTAVYDNDGFTPLFYTLHKSSPEMMKMLVDGGADINAPHKEDGRTTLIQAVREKSYTMTAALLQKGADPCLADAHGKSPLFYAREDKQVLIAALIEKEMAGDKKPSTDKPTGPKAPAEKFKGWQF